MRISDWSSDVCSSDLSNKNGFARRFRRGNEGSVGRYHARSHGAVALLLSDRRAFHAIARGSASGLRGTRADRKSVVEGKSVSVRVDLGGRRIIKKKQQTKNGGSGRDLAKTTRE